MSSLVRILCNVFTGNPPLPKVVPVEISTDELATTLDALRVLRDTRPEWRTQSRNSAYAKWFVLHAAATAKDHEAKERNLVDANGATIVVLP